ncbi:MAG TPA: hypothetical protein VHG09_05650 [Longimicrobiales bacterium]|nr:hypothetical protein [Longimicrobiales bacterium]
MHVPDPRPPNRTPAIIGFLIAGGLILGVSFFVTRLDSDSYDDVPPISILAPASGDTVTNPVTIEFRTSADLHFDTAMGWMASDLHLHAIVDSVEIMPAAADIAAQESGWTWQLPTLGAGNHRLYLTWAGRHHGNLRGQTDTIGVYVARPPDAEPTLQDGSQHH